MKHATPHRSILMPVTLLAVSLISRRTGFFSSHGRVSRRGIVTLGGLGLTALATAGWRIRSVDASPADATSGTVGCVLTPEQTEGPYYIAKEKVRSNIAEHRSGTPLTLRLTVLDVATCTPLKGAAVDIWHCDAGGVYSGFESASAGAPGGNAGPTDKATFLRGIQQTNAKGMVLFQTVYPGWYRGRTTHIHVKVHAGGKVVHTGQLFFADSLTDKVYQAAPYAARAAARDTRNSSDSIYASGGLQSTLTMKRTSTGGYIGSIALGVRRS